MSIFGAMRTSVSGMNAQGNRLSTLSDNIANADTVGYKKAGVQFQTVLDNRAQGFFGSGGVTTRARYGVSQQGLIQNTASSTDLAIQGQGFFVVRGPNGAPALTRAGSFVPDANGNLVNAAGFKLMGVNLASGNASASASGVNGLTPIALDTSGLVAAPSTKGKLSLNLASAATAVASGQLPSTNTAGASYTSKTSMVAYDNLGGKVTLDVYLTKTGTNTWEATAYNAANASSSGGFPYSSGPMSTATLAFNPANGSLLPTSASSLSVAIPGGNTIAIDMSKSTQLAAPFSVNAADVDGNAPSAFSGVQIGEDGIVSAVYQNGASIPKFRVALANVPSPDNLTPLNGNVYAVSAESGAVTIGESETGGLGSIVSSALESSTVDIATELTDMIETQRAYTANSKAFQIGTDMADVLVNLKV